MLNMNDMRMSTPTSEEFIQQHLKPFLQAKDEAIARLNREQDAFATELMDVKEQLQNASYYENEYFEQLEDLKPKLTENIQKNEKLTQKLQQTKQSAAEKNDEYGKLLTKYEKLIDLQRQMTKNHEKQVHEMVQGSKVVEKRYQEEIDKLKEKLQLAQKTQEYSAAVQFGNTREMFKLFIMCMDGYLKQIDEATGAAPQQVAAVVKENGQKLLDLLIKQSVKDSHEFSDTFVKWLTNEKERIEKNNGCYDVSSLPFLIQRYLPNYKAK